MGIPDGCAAISDLTRACEIASLATLDGPESTYTSEFYVRQLQRNSGRMMRTVRPDNEPHTPDPMLLWVADGRYNELGH